MVDKLQSIILIGTGGLIGSILRYIISNNINTGKMLPLGTLLVNVIGSFLLGSLVALVQHGFVQFSWLAFWGIGVMGSFTTMSSFAVETITISDESLHLAMVNVFITLLLVFIAAYIGKTTVHLLVPSIGQTLD